jgi:hypothetical protein
LWVVAFDAPLITTNSGIPPVANWSYALPVKSFTTVSNPALRTKESVAPGFVSSMFTESTTTGMPEGFPPAAR